MRRLTLALALAALAAHPAVAQQVPSDTTVNIQYGGEDFAVLFWPLPGRLSVSRGITSVDKGGFPPEVATTLAVAALAQFGLTCALQAPEPFMDVPGLYDVYYTC
jgi:hypothetical protein